MKVVYIGLKVQLSHTENISVLKIKKYTSESILNRYNSQENNFLIFTFKVFIKFASHISKADELFKKVAQLISNKYED